MQQFIQSASRHGRITASGGYLRSIERLWIPRRASLAQVWIQSRFRGLSADRCIVYYSGTRKVPGFTTLDYMVSGPETSLATVRQALQALDEVAALRRSVAIVTHVGNPRITERLLRRLGWEPHAPALGRGHWIKRFYSE